jgi:hypothetical protein
LATYEKVKKAVLGTDDPTERKIRFLALVTSSLPKGGSRPVLVGGSAIEVYLQGTLRTGDMDIVYKTDDLERILKDWHFDRAFRSWANEELGLAIDTVGDSMEGSPDRTTTILTKYGPATIIGIEDLILKRLASAKHWKNPSDMEQAYLLAKAHEDRIDWAYVEGEAKKQGTSDLVRRLKEMMRKT